MAMLFSMVGHFDCGETRVQLVIADSRDSATAKFEADAQSELDPDDYEDGLPEFFFDGCLVVGTITGPDQVQFNPYNILE